MLRHSDYNAINPRQSATNQRAVLSPTNQRGDLTTSSNESVALADITFLPLSYINREQLILEYGVNLGEELPLKRRANKFSIPSANLELQIDGDTPVSARVKSFERYINSEFLESSEREILRELLTYIVLHKRQFQDWDLLIAATESAGSRNAESNVLKPLLEFSALTLNSCCPKSIFRGILKKLTQNSEPFSLLSRLTSFMAVAESIKNDLRFSKKDVREFWRNATRASRYEAQFGARRFSESCKPLFRPWQRNLASAQLIKQADLIYKNESPQTTSEKTQLLGNLVAVCRSFSRITAVHNLNSNFEKNCFKQLDGTLMDLMNFRDSSTISNSKIANEILGRCKSSLDEIQSLLTKSNVRSILKRSQIVSLYVCSKGKSDTLSYFKECKIQGSRGIIVRETTRQFIRTIKDLEYQFSMGDLRMLKTALQHVIQVVPSTLPQSAVVLKNLIGVGRKPPEEFVRYLLRYTTLLALSEGDSKAIKNSQHVSANEIAYSRASIHKAVPVLKYLASQESPYFLSMKYGPEYKNESSIPGSTYDKVRLYLQAASEHNLDPINFKKFIVGVSDALRVKSARSHLSYLLLRAVKQGVSLVQDTPTNLLLKSPIKGIFFLQSVEILAKINRELSKVSDTTVEAEVFRLVSDCHNIDRVQDTLESMYTWLREFNGTCFKNEFVKARSAQDSINTLEALSDYFNVSRTCTPLTTLTEDENGHFRLTSLEPSPVPSSVIENSRQLWRGALSNAVKGWDERGLHHKVFGQYTLMELFAVSYSSTKNDLDSELQYSNIRKVYGFDHAHLKGGNCNFPGKGLLFDSLDEKQLSNHGDQSTDLTEKGVRVLSEAAYFETPGMTIISAPSGEEEGQFQIAGEDYHYVSFTLNKSLNPLVLGPHLIPSSTIHRMFKLVDNEVPPNNFAPSITPSRPWSTATDFLVHAIELSKLDNKDVLPLTVGRTALGMHHSASSVIDKQIASIKPQLVPQDTLVLRTFFEHSLNKEITTATKQFLQLIQDIRNIRESCLSGTTNQQKAGLWQFLPNSSVSLIDNVPPSAFFPLTVIYSFNRLRELENSGAANIPVLVIENEEKNIQTFADPLTLKIYRNKKNDLTLSPYGDSTRIKEQLIWSSLFELSSDTELNVSLLDRNTFQEMLKRWS